MGHEPMGHGAMGPWVGPRAGTTRALFVSQETLKKNGTRKNGALGGPYLASPENLLLGELLGTSFGAVRVPIRPFLKIHILASLWPGRPGHSSIRPGRTLTTSAFGLLRVDALGA